MRQAQEGDFQGDVAEGLFELIAIVGRVVVISRGCAFGQHDFGFVVVALKTDGNLTNSSTQAKKLPWQTAGAPASASLGLRAFRNAEKRCPNPGGGRDPLGF